jgi:CheY-like chemotaxis protein
LKILVIDDQRDAVMTLERLLTRLGHEVSTARSGEAGLQLARERLPEIIISDIGLPGMSGYQLAQAIRADETLQPRLLVAVTGRDLEEDRDQALAAGFDRHMVKPVAFDKLSTLLNTV